MPWAKPIFNGVGLVCTIICCVFTIIEKREKVLIAKWDFNKHVGKMKGLDGKWIMDPKCVHVKNKISCVQLFTNTILQ
jgi:hypothetical protein